MLIGSISMVKRILESILNSKMISRFFCSVLNLFVFQRVDVHHGLEDILGFGSLFSCGHSDVPWVRSVCLLAVDVPVINF